MRNKNNETQANFPGSYNKKECNRAKDLLTELIYLFCLDRLLYILT